MQICSSITIEKNLRVSSMQMKDSTLILHSFCVCSLMPFGGEDTIPLHFATLWKYPRKLIFNL